MSQDQNYHFGILYLMHLLIGADGFVDEHENIALRKVKAYEKIPDGTLVAFEKSILGKKEKEIYQEGIAYLNTCDDDQKLNAFVHLYKMSEADGKVHVKEVRLLLYSIRMTGIEFNDVVDKSKQVIY